MTEEDNNQETDISTLIDFDYIKENVLNNLGEIVNIEIKESLTPKFGLRPTQVRTIAINRRDVLNAASNGASLNVISNIFGIDRKTCAKYFRKEIEYAHGLARWKLQNKLFLEAMNGKLPAERIFLAKNWLGMSDNGMSEDMLEEDEGVEFKVVRPQKKGLVTETPADDTPAFEYEDRSEDTGV